MGESETLNLILKDSIGKKMALFLPNGYVYNCKIIKVTDGIVEVYDLKKNYTKYIRISSIQEIQDG